MFVSLLLVVGTGVWVGFRGRWWDEGWIWTSLVLLVAISAVMGILGTPYFDQVRSAVGLDPTHGGKKHDSAQELADPEELEALLRSRRPVAAAFVGIVGLGAIIWLMVLKPF